MSTSPTQQNEPSPVITRGLLVGSAGAFGAGLLGAIWYTKRKQAREMAREMAEAELLPKPSTPTPAQAGPVVSVKSHTFVPPKMTPAEYAVAKREASLYAFKTLGYGTLLAFGGAGLLATAVGWWLDVRNFKEFSDKLQVIVPRQTSRLRQFLGGKEFKMREEEEKELDAIELED
ncbi:hypothetical protein DFQ28_001650 [Apophysomyces sp. BC1034]|nr:hypothetical protein DFQ30_002057 [Apophysomyces sp. BC1015]KAG0179901.1 hypothetical protein DFQ29_001517 [Apophysomyces sp. BC1021]KAG0190719.1 hypothetical protein DFQ28_001650 [Apophysomyces sp. BC1034]